MSDEPKIWEDHIKKVLEDMWEMSLGTISTANVYVRVGDVSYAGYMHRKLVRVSKLTGG